MTQTSNESKVTITIIPELSVLVGLNGSIILQHLHTQLQQSPYIYDGKLWVFNFAQWCEQFPFWTEKTIRRTLGVLKNKGFLLTGNYHIPNRGSTLWYTIDYATLEALHPGMTKKLMEGERKE